MTERPNILILLADEHSPHTVGCYGNSGITTPAIDSLAARGVLFADAYCNYPLCVPSRYSFLSGLYPWRIGAWNNTSEVPAATPSLVGYLSEHGYRTAAIGKMHFVGPEQFWGFDYRPYGDFLGLSHQPDPIRTAPDLTFVPDAGPAEIPDARNQIPAEPRPPEAVLPLAVVQSAALPRPPPAEIFRPVLPRPSGPPRHSTRSTRSHASLDAKSPPFLSRPYFLGSDDTKSARCLLWVRNFH